MFHGKKFDLNALQMIVQLQSRRVSWLKQQIKYIEYWNLNYLVFGH